MTAPSKERLEEVLQTIVVDGVKMSETIIVCPNPKCGKWLAKTSDEIKAGAPVHDISFQPIGNLMAKGEPMVCSRCGYPYFYNGKIHTKEGWKP